MRLNNTALGGYSPFREQKPSISLTCPRPDPYVSIVLNEQQPVVSGSHLSGLRWLLPLPPAAHAAQPPLGPCPQSCPLQPSALPSLSGTQSPRAAHRGRLPRSLPGRRERLPGPGSPAPGAREPPPRPAGRHSRRPVPPSITGVGRLACGCWLCFPSLSPGRAVHGNAPPERGAEVLLVRLKRQKKNPTKFFALTYRGTRRLLCFCLSSKTFTFLLPQI